MAEEEVEATPAAEVPAENGDAKKAEKKAPVDWKKVPKPDEQALKDNISAIEADIEGIQAKIAKIKDTLDNKNSSRDGQMSETMAARQKLQEMRSETRRLLQQRNNIYAEINDADEARSNRVKEMNKLRGNLPFTNVDEIDKAIREKEYIQQTQSLGLKEVKTLMAEIAQLTAAKPMVKEYNSHLEMLKTDKERSNLLYGKLKEKNGEVNMMREMEEKQRTELESKSSKEGKVKSVVPELLKEREELKKQMSAKRDEMRALRDTFNAERKVYLQAQRELRNIRNEQRKKEWEAREEERKQKRAEWEAEEAKRIPWEYEMEVIDTMVAFLSAKLPKESNGTVQEAAKIEHPEGLVPRGKRHVEEEDYLMMGGGKKKGKKNKQKKADDAPAAPKNMPYSHTPESLSQFESFCLKPPMWTSDIPEAVQQLKDKKAYFQTRPSKEEVATLKKEWKKKTNPQKAMEEEAEEAKVAEEKAAIDEAAAADKKAAAEEEAALPEASVPVEEAPVLLAIAPLSDSAVQVSINLC